MNQGNGAVTITLDGLALFRFDGSNASNTRCEVHFLKEDHHHPQIQVMKRNGRTSTISDETLGRFETLWLYVNKGTSYDSRKFTETGSASEGEFYRSILPLDGPDFYPLKPLPVRRSQYGPSLFVCDGAVGSHNAQAACPRVEITENSKYSYKSLRYNLSDSEWNQMKNDENLKPYIREIPPFLRWVDVAIDLSPNDDLILAGITSSGATEYFPLIENYVQGEDYWIHVLHTDVHTHPNSLSDCKGFALLSESVERNGSPVYGVFAPNKVGLPKPGPPWPTISTDTSEGTCCLPGKGDDINWV